MSLKKFFKNFFIFFLFTALIFIFYSKYIKKNNPAKTQDEDKVDEKINYNSNLIKDVEYLTKDTNGNQYLIKALEGEVDFSNTNIIYLKNVFALIKLNNSEKITIFSDFGKYNSENNDTIFSKNVIYTNQSNVLNADAVQMDIKTKNTKIFMYENEKKVNLKTRN